MVGTESAVIDKRIKIISKNKRIRTELLGINVSTIRRRLDKVSVNSYRLVKNIYYLKKTEEKG